MKLNMNLAVLAACVLTGTSAAQAQVRVNINGTPVNFVGTQPQMVDSHVMVPLRSALEQMGANVSCNEAQQTVTTTRGSSKIILRLGEHSASVDGQLFPRATPAIKVTNRILVPLRFLSESLGANVGWDQLAEVVSIDTNTETFAPAATAQ